MSLVITANARLLIFGHSFVAQNLHGFMLGKIVDYFTKPLSQVNLTTPAGAQRPTIILKGVSGDDTNNFVARRVADITNQTPTHVIMIDGLNDIGHGVLLATSQANWDTLFATAAAATGNAANVAAVSILLSGTNPPPGNANDAAIDTYNTMCAARAAAAGCKFIDVRTPYKAFRSGGGGIIAADGAHVDRPPTGGATDAHLALYGSWLMQGITLT